MGNGEERQVGNVFREEIGITVTEIFPWSSTRSLTKGMVKKGKKRGGYAVHGKKTGGRRERKERGRVKGDNG